jgi:hypothetical protein
MVMPILSNTVGCSGLGFALAGGDTKTVAIIATMMVLRAVLLIRSGQRVKVTSRQTNVRNVIDSCVLVKGRPDLFSVFLVIVPK